MAVHLRFLVAAIHLLAAAVVVSAGEPVQVFILAGQSNMVGAGKVEGDANRNGGKGSLSFLAENDPKFAHLKKGGKWAERDDVAIWFLGRKGPLAPGYGSNGGTIGPELGFGHVMGEALDAPVLLIKTAWGGKSLAVDFRPPSSGGEVGPFYTEMFTHVRNVLENLKKEFPEFRDGYEVAGFGWHQGWNDGCDMGMCQEYEENMENFIRDVRQELGVEDLPFVIADSGFGGEGQDHPRRLMIRDAQAGAAKKFKGTATCVPTAPFFRPEGESPSNQGYHWNGNAETYYLIGEAMGEAMLELMGSAEPEPQGPGPMRVFRNTDGTRTFEGQLLGYDAATGKVTVRNRGGRTLTFDLGALHPEDQDYVKGE